MKTEFKGKDVNRIVYEEDGNENGLTIYWNDGNKTKCLIVEQL